MSYTEENQLQRHKTMGASSINLKVMRRIFEKNSKKLMSLLDVTSSLPAVLVGAHHAAFTRPGPSCSKVESTIHWINLYSLDRANWFP